MRTYKKAVLPLIALVVTCCLTAETTKVVLDTKADFSIAAERLKDPDTDLRLLFVGSKLLEKLKASDSILIVVPRVSGDLHYFHKLTDRKVGAVTRQLVEAFDLGIYQGLPLITCVHPKTIITLPPHQFLKESGEFIPGSIVILSNVSVRKMPL